MSAKAQYIVHQIVFTCYAFKHAMNELLFRLGVA